MSSRAFLPQFKTPSQRRNDNETNSDNGIRIDSENFLKRSTNTFDSDIMNISEQSRRHKFCMLQNEWKEAIYSDVSLTLPKAKPSDCTWRVVSLLNVSFMLKVSKNIREALRRLTN